MTTRTIHDRVIEHSQAAGSSELALRRHGLDGDRLLKLARKIARDHTQRTASTLGDRFEDLVMFLTEQALRKAVQYDPTRSAGGYTFESYLCDIMEARVPDFYRRRSEGFGDRRYGNDNRLVLTDKSDTDADPDVDFDRLISERRVARYQHAADIRALPLQEWIVITLDLAAAHAERHAA